MLNPNDLQQEAQLWREIAQGFRDRLNGGNNHDITYGGLCLAVVCIVNRTVGYERSLLSQMMDLRIRKYRCRQGLQHGYFWPETLTWGRFDFTPDQIEAAQNRINLALQFAEDCEKEASEQR